MFYGWIKAVIFWFKAGVPKVTVNIIALDTKYQSTLPSLMFTKAGFLDEKYSKNLCYEILLQFKVLFSILI